MNSIDGFLQNFQLWIHSKPLLYRFTLGTKILLAVGFIPTGFVKMLGYRFTELSIDSDVGALFEVLYQSGLYWQFLGFAQVLASVLILIPTVSALGVVLFLGIIINIFMITISYDFAFTSVITSQMLLASIWLILWDYDRLRGLIFSQSMNNIHGNMSDSLANKPATLHKLTLENSLERGTYLIGAISGLLFFSMLRGLALPSGFEFILLALCLLSFITAIVLGLRYSKIKN